MTKRYTLLSLVFMLIMSVAAQITVRVEELTPDDTPLGYNEDTLRSWILNRLHGGGGLIDTNSIKFIGNPQALGRFWNGSDLGLDSGLVISNGKVTSITPPNGIGLMSDKMGTPGDPDLLKMYNMIFAALGGKDTLIDYTGDAAVIEFIYRPFGEEIILDYVFASEEYPNVRPPDADLTGFSGSGQIYDLFGISMERSNTFNNLALRIEDAPPPGTPDPYRWVNVGNINAGNFPSYYQQNPTITVPTGQNLGTQFDGFTKQVGDLGKMFVRRRDVTPCASYKIKIAIEDFWFDYPTNEQLDGFTVNSAVFLGAKSLYGGMDQPEWTSSHYFTNPALEGQLIEECNDLVVTFTLDKTFDEDYYIPFRVVADAYRDKCRITYFDSGLPLAGDSVHFQPDSTVVTILVEAINLSADIPNITFQYAANPCEKRPSPFGGPVYSGRIPLILRNNEPFSFTQNPKIYEAYCKETIDLTITDVTQGGVTPINFIWNGELPAADQYTYQVNGSPDFVNVVVSDVCSNSASTQVQIVNKPIVLESILDAFLCGPGQQQVVVVNAAIPNYPDYSIDQVRWFKLPDNTPLGNAAGNEITVTYDEVVGDGIWTCGFEVTDVCGGTQTGQFLVNQSELTLGADIWICKGETRQITANAQAQSFEWYDVSNPDVILSNTASVTVTPSITTTYELKILDLCDHEQTAQITVNVDLFEPAIVIDPASAEICPGETITLTANDAQSWEWQPGGETTQTIILNPVIPNTYNYTLTASSLYCIDKEATATFTVFPTPSAEFSYTPDAEACTGEEIIFSYLDDPAGKTFDWSFGDGGTSSQPDPTHTYQDAGVFTIDLRVDQYICWNDSSIQMTINPLPSPEFEADVLEGCLPVVVRFTDLTTDAFPNADYLWEFGDGESSEDKNPQHEYDTPGVFSIKLTVNNTDRCASTIVHPNLIQVNPNPEAAAEADPWITTLDTPEIDFTSLSISDSVILRYHWDFGDGDTSALPNPSHTYASAGEYEISLYIETVNGCWDTTLIRVVLTEEVRLFFPNAFTPNGDGLNDTFEIKGTPIADYNLYIIDRWGGQIWSTHNFENQWDGTNAAGEPVPAGVYVYKVNGTDYLSRPLNFTGTVSLVR